MVSDQSTALSALASGFAHVGHETAAGGILVALFTAGLLGSLGHCVGMCGPFVLAQTEQRLSRVPADRLRGFHRVSGGGLLPYQLGRLTTYIALGALAASVTGELAAFSGLRWVAALLLLSAAVSFLGHAVRRIRFRLPWRSTGDSVWSRLLTRIARPLFTNPTGARGYALGLALGLLPCSLLYGAIAAAAATMDTATGAAAMAAFALGTMPALVAVGCFGDFALGRWPKVARTLAPSVMIMNAGLLAAAAIHWIA